MSQPVLLRKSHEELLRKLLNMLMKMLLVMLLPFPVLFGNFMRVTMVGQPYVVTTCVTSLFISQPWLFLWQNQE